jgi:hypothetical protein
MRPIRIAGTTALLAGLIAGTPLCSPAHAQSAALPGVHPTDALALATADAPVRVRVNLPAYRLDVLSGESLQKSFKVAIGSPRYATPSGEHQVQRIIWNPWWHPPQSAWAAGKKPVAPGAANPMGRAKIHLEGLYYIHGSPERGSMGSAASHGCIRMLNEDVIEVARIVHAAGSGASALDVDALIASPKRTREVNMPGAVQVEVVYELAEVQGDSLVLYADVYGRAKGDVLPHVRSALERAGHDTARLDEAAVLQLARSKKKRTEVALSEVLKEAPVLLGMPVD